MAKCGHYAHWRTDFDLLQELGIRFLRYGPPIHTTFLGEGRYDWEFADATFEYLRLRDVIPIVDLCHFGLPDWIGNFQNPDFPKLFGAYARDFRGPVPVGAALHAGQRDVHLRPVLGRLWLVERAAHHRPRFVTALKHIVQANQRAMAAILEVRADAIFIQSESSEYFHAENPRAIKPAEIMNARRFLSLDLNYGRRVASEMYEYIMDNGMTRRSTTGFWKTRRCATTASWATTITSPTSTG
jgi:beta-glucosidase/6-phospho-beta-glucosidase/beta-galactosidase